MKKSHDIARAAVFRQANHFATHQVGEHGPELLAFPALNFVDAQMSRSVFRARAVPGLEKRVRVPEILITTFPEILITFLPEILTV